MLKRIFSIIFFFCFFLNCSPPDPQKTTSIQWGKATDSILHDTTHVKKVVDSLKKEILRGPADTVSINLLNDLAERSSGKSALILSSEALVQSRKINYKFGEADAFCRRGFYFFISDAYDSASYYLNKCLSIAQKENFTVLKIQALSILGNVCRYQFDSLGADTNIRKAIALSKTINEHRRRAMCYNMLGESAMFYGQPDIARKYLDSAGIEAEISGEKSMDSYALLVLGSLYIQQGDYTTAMEKFSRSLAVGIEAQDNVRIASAYGSIGEIYYSQKIMDKAMENLDRSVHYAALARDTIFMAYDIAVMGQIYFEQKDYDKSLLFLDSAISLSKRKYSPLIVAEALGAKGMIYNEKGNAQEAKRLLFESTSIAKKISHPALIANNLASLAEICLKIGEKDSAMFYAKQALEIGKSINGHAEMKSASNVLWQVYRNNSDYKNAFDMHVLYSDMKDSVSSEEQVKRFAEVEYRAKENKLMAEQTKKDAFAQQEKLRKDEEIRRQKLVNYGTSAGGALALILLFVSVRAYRNKQKANSIISGQKEEVESQKHLLEEKNKEIIDSINYAKRLQNAILPSVSEIKSILPDSFLLYLPKDIVAGDFYWFENVARETILFAVADSTGHGVPGAMVSVVCSNALNRSTKEFNLNEPGKILDKTRELVLETFIRKDNSFEKTNADVKDGMDISLCNFNPETNELQFSGANNSLWIIRKEELIELRADRQPVGKTENPLPFTNHKFQLIAGDVFYLFTDGFSDQFGGPKGKKFMSANLKKLLLSIQNESMDQQEKIIRSTFESWKGILEQVDDVTVMGVRI